MAFIFEIFMYIVFSVFLSAVCSIAHFAIEDLLGLETSKKLLLCYYGSDYARCLSIVLTLSLFMIVCLAIKKKICEKPLLNFETNILKIFRGLSICITFFIIMSIIIQSIYMFINAEMTTSIALQKLVTCIFTGIFIAYYFIDVKQLFITKYKLYATLFYMLITLSIFGSLVAFYKIADIGAVKRVMADFETHEIVSNMRSSWEAKDVSMQKRIDDIERIRITKDPYKRKVKYSINKENLTVDFKRISSSHDLEKAKTKIDSTYKDSEFFKEIAKYSGRYTKIYQAPQEKNEP